MDLPHYAVGRGPMNLPNSLAPDSPDKRRDLEDIAPRSSFYQALAKAAGFRSFDETWDRLFETPRARMTIPPNPFAATSRYSAPPFARQPHPHRFNSTAPSSANASCGRRSAPPLPPAKSPPKTP